MADRHGAVVPLVKLVVSESQSDAVTVAEILIGEHWKSVAGGAGSSAPSR